MSRSAITCTLRAPSTLLLVALTSLPSAPTGAATAGARHGQEASVAALETRAEATDYMETSRYADVVAFIDAVVPASPRLHRADFGYSLEGRALPMVVFGDVPSASAEAVLASGKTRVWIQGNIHAGEVCGKEAMLMLLRELALGEHAGWADSLVLLIAPIYNADGNERIEVGHRGRQNGPLAGMGQRPNAQGLDLNRDHMKLESPEARSLVRMMSRYDPHVAVDLHTTNGTQHAYHLTYSPPLHPNTPPAIDRLLRDEWLPWVSEQVERESGWHTYYYGNAGRGFRGDLEPGWRTFDHRPRFNNNYVGLRNRFAILSEAYAYASFEERVLASKLFTEKVVDWAAANAGRIREVVEAADATPLVGESLALRAEAVASDEPVEILMGETEAVLDPISGRRILRRLDVVRPQRMLEYGRFGSTLSRRVPARYYVPATREVQPVLDNLAFHGVATGTLDSDTTVAVEEFRITSSSQASREFQGHRERTLEGEWIATETTLPAGTAVVEMDQPLARLVFTLLEPLSDDGLANWNLLDRALEGSDTYPILRAH